LALLDVLVDSIVAGSSIIPASRVGRLVAETFHGIGVLIMALRILEVAVAGTLARIEPLKSPFWP